MTQRYLYSLFTYFKMNFAFTSRESTIGNGYVGCTLWQFILRGVLVGEGNYPPPMLVYLRHIHKYTKSGGLGLRNSKNSENTIKVKYKIDQNSKTINRTKIIMNSKIHFRTLRILWNDNSIFRLHRDDWTIFFSKSAIYMKDKECAEMDEESIFNFRYTYDWFCTQKCSIF